VNGEVIDIRDALKEGGDNPLNLGRYEQHTIEAVVDRIVIKDRDARSRLADSIEVALKLSEGLLIVLIEDGTARWSAHQYSEKFACPVTPSAALDRTRAAAVLVQLAVRRVPAL
jgi:excinuclease ABC subunit A